MTEKANRKYIEGAGKMNWTGSYKNAESVQVGAGSLISAFKGMYGYVSQESPQPSEEEVRRWCDILVIHFPEAGRFDSLALCSIHNRFVDGGRVGCEPVKKAHNWSSDCRGALRVLTLTAEADNSNRKRNAKMLGTKNLSVKKGKEMTNSEVQRTIKDVRLFTRPMPANETARLSSLPVQLLNGKLVRSFPEELDAEDAKMKKFLIEAVDNGTHKSCGYVNEEWICSCLDSISGKQHGSHKFPGPTGSVNRAEEHNVLLASDSYKVESKMTPSSQEGDGAPGSRNTAFDTAGGYYDQSTLPAKKVCNPGLCNLGQTCYINSTLQCLYVVPELKSALWSISNGNCVDQASYNLALATHNTFRELDQSVGPVVPQQLINALHKRYPQFAQKKNNFYMHQDAEEFWSLLMSTLSETLTLEASESEASPTKALFGIGCVTRVHCEESGESSETPPQVLHHSLKCLVSRQTNHLREGVKNGLKSYSDEFSPALGRLASHTRESTVNVLPRYLTVKFERSVWNEKSKQTEKILRKVDYPVELDIYEFCSDHLKQKLEAPRQMLRGQENAAFGLEAHGKTSSSKENEGSSYSIGKLSSMDIHLVEPSVPTEKLTGIYDLIGIITHAGEGVNSGHYVGWIKQGNGTWAEFDDDKVTIYQEEEVLKLCGGDNADAQIAYICLYKARVAE